MFTFKNEDIFIIANIASQNSINNILENPNVCVSLVVVFIQKGFKLKGIARIITMSDTAYHDFIETFQ